MLVPITAYLPLVPGFTFAFESSKTLLRFSLPFLQIFQRYSQNVQPVAWQGHPHIRRNISS